MVHPTRLPGASSVADDLLAGQDRITRSVDSQTDIRTPGLLRVHTLGSVFVERDGNSLEGRARQRRVLALLAALANAGDGGISRDRILDLLWTDADPERSRQALTQALYHARRALDCDELFLTSATIRLNPALITSDVAEFEALLDAGRADEAVALYGGPFLDGFYVPGAGEFERWVSSERARLEARQRKALEELANGAEAAGDAALAVDYRKRLVASDPLNSAATLAYMRVLAQAGDRAAAIQHARVHETLLRDALDVAPDSRIGELAEQLRREPERAPSSEPVIEPVVARNDDTIAIADDDVAIGASARHATPAPLVVSSPIEAPRPYPRATRRPRLRIAIGLVAALAAVVGIVRLTRRPEPPAPRVTARPVRDLLIVAPFRVSGADPALAYLHEGMVDLLVTKLTEDDAAHAADPGSIMSAWRRVSATDRSEVPTSDAIAVARALGGERLVSGSIVGTPQRMVVSASLLRVGDSTVSAQATVEGPSDSLNVLVDRLATRLVAKEVGVADRLASHTTTSLSALRAFLLAQASYRRGAYRIAAQHYRAAIARDSNVAMAAIGLAQSSTRLGAEDEATRAIAIAWRARSELTEPDRLYLQALAGPRYPARSSRREILAAWELAASEAPNRPGVWHELGERLFYDGALLGMRDARRRALTAFSRASKLDSAFAAPLLYQVQLAAEEGDTGAVRRSAALYAALDSTGELAAFVRWRSAVSLRDERHLVEIRRGFGAMPTPSLHRLVLASQYGGVATADAEAAVRVLRNRAVRRSERLDVLAAEHAIATNGAQPSRAHTVLEELEDAQATSALGTRLIVLDALYAGADSVAAARAVQRLLARAELATVTPETDADRASSRCVAGLWLAARGDLAVAQRAATALAASKPTSLGDGFGAACAALIDASAAVRARRRDADARITRAETLLAAGAPVSELHEYAYLAVSRLRSMRGDARGALAAIRRRPWMQEWPHHLGAALSEEGRLALQVGDGASALGAYRQLLALRPAPEASESASTAAIRAQVDSLTERAPR